MILISLYIARFAEHHLVNGIPFKDMLKGNTLEMTTVEPRTNNNNFKIFLLEAISDEINLEFECVTEENDECENIDEMQWNTARFILNLKE